MKNSFISFPCAALLACAAAVLPACSEKQEMPSEEKTYTISGEADKDGKFSFTKALELSSDEMTLTAPWEKGEKVYVYLYKNGQYQKKGMMECQGSGTGTVNLTGSVNGSFSVNDNLLFSYLHELTFDYSGQTGDLEDVAKNYDYAVTGASISRIVGETIPVGMIRMESQQCIVKFTLKDEEGNPIYPDRFTIDTVNDGTSDTYPQFAKLFVPSANPWVWECGPVEVVPRKKTNELFVALTGNYTGSGILYGLYNAHLLLTAVVGNDVYTYEKQNVTFNNNKYYVIEVDMKKQ